MASQGRFYDQKKLLGQVYTPLHIVEKILNHTEFYSRFGEKKILDPACGDGRFLVPIVQHIILHSSNEDLMSNLLQVHGWDIDDEALASCRQNLDELIRHLDISVPWNLRNLDALKQLDSAERFDLIVGNPPYIRIQHLPESQRKYVQNTYSFCQTGSTDAYVAFFQLGFTLLSDNGVCGFITPNSYLSSETAKYLRNFFETNKNLIHITNYGTALLFGSAGTYSAITIFTKSERASFFYEKYEKKESYAGRNISFSELGPGNHWRLSLTPAEEASGKRLGDICKISVGITTLSDSLYLFSLRSQSETTVVATNRLGNEIRLEKSILRPIVKGSKLKNSDDPIKEYVLFPYQKDASGKHRIIPEDVLQTQFPLAYQYFTSVRTTLEQRDNGKPNSVAWYAFGRAQSLDSAFGRKIIFSPMNNTPNFVLYENPECTVYSGYFIKYDGNYEALLQQLNSQRMADFVAIAGRDFQGGYKGYNKKILENFIITDYPDCEE